MESIGTHGLACLSDNDPAAIALYLQRLAEDAEAALGTSYDELFSAVNRPTSIWGVSVNLAGVTSSSDFFNVNLFTNSTGPTYVTSGGVARPALPGGAFGTYHVGMYVAVTPAGVAAGSSHFMFVTAAPISSSLPAIASMPDTVQETSTAGENLSTGMIFQTTLANTNDAPVVLQTLYNVGSGTSTILSSSYLWATYIGPPDFVELS